MSEENLLESATVPERDEEEAQEPESAPENAIPDVGQHLRLAREARGVSVAEVSAALKLSPRQVKAIEANEWLRWPRTVIRGFVRNYARFLDLDTTPLMAALDDIPMPEGSELVIGAPSAVDMPREGGGDRRDYARVIAGLIVLILAILACLLIPVETWQSGIASIKALISEKQADSTMVATPSGISGIVLPAPEVVIVPISDPVKDAPPTRAAPVSASLPAPLPDPVSTPAASPAPSIPAPDPAPPSGEGLSFFFEQSSWVEVRDGNGQLLLSKILPAGSQREIGGQPPFSLIVGNSPGVTLYYRGKPVPLAQHGSGGVARLTLE
jgi:cytoskeleton protein RodZ